MTALLGTPIALALFTALAFAQSEPGKARPFTARWTGMWWTESGRYTDRPETFARGSDGSWAFVSEAENPSDPKAARGPFSYALNATKRQYIIAESFTKAAVVKPVVDDKEFKELASAYGTCENLSDGTWKEMSQSTLLGFDVIEVEVEHTERSLVKSWVAPALQCFALRHVEFIDGNLRQKWEIGSLQQKEPDPSMFGPPEGYELVTPIELEKRYQAMFPGSELYGRFAATMEERYQRAKQTQH